MKRRIDYEFGVLDFPSAMPPVGTEWFLRKKKDNSLISSTDFPELIVKYAEILLAGIKLLVV